jgi:hypothetical protein
MTEIHYFLIGLFFCIIIVLTIIFIIHERFYVMMIDLCEGEDRARFWTVAVEAWFFLFSVTSALKWCPDAITDRELFLASIEQIKAGLSDMSYAIILFCAGLLMFVAIRKFKGREVSIGGQET